MLSQIFYSMFPLQQPLYQLRQQYRIESLLNHLSVCVCVCECVCACVCVCVCVSACKGLTYLQNASTQAIEKVEKLFFLEEVVKIGFFRLKPLFTSAFSRQVSLSAQK
jgi:hypothetical protein